MSTLLLATAISITVFLAVFVVILVIAYAVASKDLPPAGVCIPSRQAITGRHKVEVTWRDRKRVEECQKNDPLIRPSNKPIDVTKEFEGIKVKRNNRQ